MSMLQIKKRSVSFCRKTANVFYHCYNMRYSHHNDNKQSKKKDMNEASEVDEQSATTLIKRLDKPDNKMIASVTSNI